MTFLVDYMTSLCHMCILPFCPQVLSIEGAVPSVASPLTSDLLKHFAFEAESAGDYELTHRYHKEVRGRGHHTSWERVGPQYYWVGGVMLLARGNITFPLM